MSGLSTMACMLYWVGAALLALAFLGRHRRVGLAARLALASGCVVHLVAWGWGRVSIATPSGWVGWYLFFAFAVALVQSFHFRLRHTLALVAAFPVVASVAAVFLPTGGGASGTPGLWHGLHQVALAGAYGAFSLGFGAGCLLLLQDYLLKRKVLGFWWDRMPSLDALDHLTYSNLALGFVAMSVVVLSGFLRPGSSLAFAWNGRVAAGVVLWAVYGLSVHARSVAGFRGRRLGLVSICGFLVACAIFVSLVATMGAGA